MQCIASSPIVIVSPFINAVEAWKLLAVLHELDVNLLTRPKTSLPWLAVLVDDHAGLQWQDVS